MHNSEIIINLVASCCIQCMNSCVLRRVIYHLRRQPNIQRHTRVVAQNLQASRIANHVTYDKHESRNGIIDNYPLD